MERLVFWCAHLSVLSRPSESRQAVSVAKTGQSNRLGCAAQLCILDFMKKTDPSTIPTVSASLPDGTAIEMVYDPVNGRTALCRWDGSTAVAELSIAVGDQRLAAFPADNNLIKHGVVLFASEPADHGNPVQLVGRVRAFIHELVDVSAEFEEIASHYVLLTWLYDRFSALPYLRVMGDPGSGKTRFLAVVGSLCYKPVFASGASTVSPLFRILDTFKGTLVLDESDFRVSDEMAGVVKILNNGFSKGFPVLRSEPTGRRDFNPQAYAVFGPKIIATRRLFEDAALESRCLTEEMGQGRVRDDVPVSLPDDFDTRAETLRNQLLDFRFKMLGRPLPPVPDFAGSLEPRLKQIIEPLLRITPDAEAQGRMVTFAVGLQKQIVSDRGMEIEARLLEVIRELTLESPLARLTIRNIWERFIYRHGDDYERRITTRWIGGVIRGSLHLKTQKSDGVYVIPPSEEPKLRRLYVRYGIVPNVPDVPEGPAGSELSPRS